VTPARRGCPCGSSPESDWARGSSPVSGLPPLLLQVGSAEALLDDAVRVAERARAAGVAADLRVWQHMFHVWHAFAEILPEAQQAVDEMAAFLEERLASSARGRSPG
jgi:acetyl esterase/lipase